MSSCPCCQAVLIFTTKSLERLTVQSVFVQLIQLYNMVENFRHFPEARMNSQDYWGVRWKRKNSLGYPEDRMVGGLEQGH